MEGAVKLVAIVSVMGTLLASPTVGQRSPWLAPKGSQLKASELRERLRKPAVGPEDVLREERLSKAPAACLECQLAALVLQEQLEAGTNLTTLVLEGTLVCHTALAYTLAFCEGYVPMIMPIIYNILTNNDVTPKDACGELFSYLGCTSDDPKREWSVTLQGEKPPVVPITPPEPDAPRLKVLHLADTHVDPFYRAGSNAVCPDDLCCREESGMADEEEAKAWYWGDYRHCGTPVYLLEEMLRHAATIHPDIDYVIWTGDAVPHNMWSTTPETNIRILKEVNDIIGDFFPGVPVFPVVGNHEMSPLDQFPEPGAVPEELSADWLYKALVSQWSKLVPDLDSSTVRHAGYYSVPLRPGFRVISFNSMFGYTGNMWLVANSRDPASQLEWLEAELNKAEAAGELVHLLGHVPPGLINAERTWSREYNRIIVRYENIIRGQFFGHTHYDEIEVFHDGERPIGVAYIAPSVTPWFDLNPAYRIYHVDGERPGSTWTVLDHETYVMNLTNAHETGLPTLYQLYDARHLYDMPGLTPQDWNDLAERMAQDRDLFDLYFKNFVSGGDPYLTAGCDDLCYNQRLCDMVTSDRNDLDHCHDLLRRKNRT